MKTVNRLLFSLLLAAAAALASTTYSQQVTNVTSVTIPGTTHNLGCLQYGVLIYDSNGVRQPATAFTASKNATTFDATVSFSSAFTGTVKLNGCFHVTSASTDFQVTATAGVVTVCAACTDVAPAVRLYNSQFYVEPMSFTFTGNSDGQSGTAWVYLNPADGHVYYALSSASGVGTASTGSFVVYGQSGFPSNAVALATVSYSASGFGSVTDNRPF